MSRLRKLVRLFTLRRISGQIAALILSTLVLIHALIAGYVLVSRPKPSLLTDEPLQQFELIVRILDKTPRNERRVLVENIGRGLPDLQLRLTEGGPRASATPTTAIPSPFDGRVQIVQRRPPEQDSVLFDLGDGEVLDATVRTPSIPDLSPAFGQARCCSWSSALRCSGYGPAGRSARPYRPLPGQPRASA
ncbi:hypothetical protein [Bradyrhizobium diazoefficiens]